jgi:Rrf2 family protein
MRALSEKTILALYALQVLLHQCKPTSSREISRSAGLAPAPVRSVLRLLAKAGFVRSRPRGGYFLAKPPGDIRVLDIVHAVDAPLEPAAPCGGDYDACVTRATCVLAPLCRNAEQAFQESLRTFTLADLEYVPVDLPNCVDPRLRIRVS